MAGVTVGERDDGVKLLAYGLGHAFEKRWGKRKSAGLLASGQEPEVPADSGGVSASLDSTVVEGGDAVNEGLNIVILKVIDKATGQRLTDYEDDAGQEGHEAVVEPEPTTDPQPIEVTGKELGDFTDTPEGEISRRAATRVYLEEKLQGEWVDVPAIGREVEIRQRGIDESINWSAKPKKLMALAKLKEIIGGAHSPDYQPNYKPQIKPSALQYIHLKNTVNVAGEMTPFTVIVEEDLQGLLHYDIMIDPQKTKVALDDSGATSAGVMLSRIPNPGFSLNFSMDQAGEEGNGGRLVLNLFIEGEEPEAVADPEGEAVETASPAPVPLIINGNTYTALDLDESGAQSAMDAAMARNAGDLFAAARDVYQNTMQGHFVDTKIGPVLITGGGWQEMKNRLKQDELRARTLPFIPVVLREGEVGAPEALYKVRTDGTLRFHPFTHAVDLGDVTVKALLKVAEREDHSLVYHLTATPVLDAAQTQNPPEAGSVRDEVFRGSGVPSEPTTEPESTSSPLLTVIDSVGEDLAGFNLIILEVIDKATGQRLTDYEDDVGQEGHEAVVASRCRHRHRYCWYRPKALDSPVHSIRPHVKIGQSRDQLRVQFT